MPLYCCCWAGTCFSDSVPLQPDNGACCADCAGLCAGRPSSLQDGDFCEGVSAGECDPLVLVLAVETLMRNETSARPQSVLNLDKVAFCACRAIADKLMLKQNERITCEGSHHTAEPPQASLLGPLPEGTELPCEQPSSLTTRQPTRTTDGTALLPSLRIADVNGSYYTHLGASGDSVWVSSDYGSDDHGIAHAFDGELENENALGLPAAVGRGSRGFYGACHDLTNYHRVPIRIRYSFERVPSELSSGVPILEKKVRTTMLVVAVAGCCCVYLHACHVSRGAHGLQCHVIAAGFGAAGQQSDRLADLRLPPDGARGRALPQRAFHRQQRGQSAAAARASD